MIFQPIIFLLLGLGLGAPTSSPGLSALSIENQYVLDAMGLELCAGLSDVLPLMNNGAWDESAKAPKLFIHKVHGGLTTNSGGINNGITFLGRWCWSTSSK